MSTKPRVVVVDDHALVRAGVKSEIAEAGSSMSQKE